MTYTANETQVWNTKGARLNAYRRLMRKQRASMFTQATLAIVCLLASLLPLTEMYPEYKSYAAALSAAAAVFLLVISLLEYAKGYEVKAERLHTNAMQLGRLWSELRHNQSNSQEVNRLMMEYHQLLLGCPENHEPCDFNMFKAQHPDPNSTLVDRVWDRTIYHLNTYLFYVLIALPFAAILYAAIPNTQGVDPVAKAHHIKNESQPRSLD